MAAGLDLKKTISFSIIGAKLVYGNGPFEEVIRSQEGEEISDRTGLAILYLTIKPRDYQLARLLENNSAGAKIYRHPIGQELTGTGVPARGQLNIIANRVDVQGGKSVEVIGFLQPEVFDSVTTAITSGGTPLLAKSRLRIGLKEEADKIDFDRPNGVLQAEFFLIDDLSISFEIGEGL